MLKVEEVERISSVSKLEKWPYPKTFQALLDAGVTSYRTSIATNDTVFSGGGQQFEEANAASTSGLKIAEQFQAEAVKRGLEHHQQNRTPFTEFLQDMAAAGVQYYEVDMTSRIITYTSGRADESYAEAVPVFES
jgi:uncharacterized protein YbcV (DUF1398 family)